MVITSPTVSYEPAIRRALSSQLAIGLVNLFRGYVSQEWGHIYAASDTTPLSERHTRATSHTSPAVMAIQDYAIAIWQHRNSILHEAGSPGMASIHTTLNHSIVQIYGLQKTFTPIIQSYFKLSLEDRLCTSPRQRARWLMLVQLATSHALARGSRQALVSHYFAYTRRTPVHPWLLLLLLRLHVSVLLLLPAHCLPRDVYNTVFCTVDFLDGALPC